MEPKTPNRNLGLLLVVTGFALLAAAVVLITIDSDPAWLFGDPVLSAVLALGAGALMYLGWKRMRTTSTDQ
jgi:hypothetical protein